MSDAAPVPVVVADPADQAAPPSTIGPPLTAQTEQPPAPPAEIAPPPDEPDAYVPVAAVHAVRQENRALKEQLATSTQQFQGLQQQVAELSQRLAQLPQAPVPPAPPAVSDDLARAWAIKHQIYKTDGSGQPDLDAARDAVGVIQREAREIAQQAIAPVLQATARDRAMRYKEQLSQLKDPAGRPIDPRAIEQVFNLLPPEVTADPNAAIWLAMMAAGAERFSQAPAIPPPELAPVYSERAGGRAQGPSVSDYEMRYLKSQGRDVKAHSDAVKQYKPGEPFPLE